MKRFVSAVLITIFTLSCFNFPYAEASNLSEAQQERDRINAEVKDTQSSIYSTSAEMSRVMSEIEALDEELTRVAEDLEVIGNNLTDTQNTLTRLEAELEQARDDRDNQFIAYKERLRVMYEYGPVSFLEVLFNAASVRDFLTRLEYMNEIARSDQQITERMQQSEEKVSSKVEEISRHRNTFEVLQYTQTVRQEELSVSLSNRENYFAQLDADKERYDALLEIQLADQLAIEAIYQQRKKEEEDRQRAAQAAARAAITYNGVLGWPAPVYKYISDTYRARVNPVNGRGEFHTGVDIAASMGSDIIAADAGVVIMARYNGGFGNCVIIDHGGGVSTLYGHASRLVVTEGQSVRKGETIAKVGSTGISTGPHLHFEVHINGKHTDPKPYLGY